MYPCDGGINLLLSSLTHHHRSSICVIGVSILLLSSLTHHQRSCIRVMEVSMPLVFCVMVGSYTFSGVRVAQSLVFCVMVDTFLVGFVWFNL